MIPWIINILLLVKLFVIYNETDAMYRVQIFLVKSIPFIQFKHANNNSTVKT